MRQKLAAAKSKRSQDESDLSASLVEKLRESQRLVKEYQIKASEAEAALQQERQKRIQAEHQLQVAKADIDTLDANLNEEIKKNEALTAVTGAASGGDEAGVQQQLLDAMQQAEAAIKERDEARAVAAALQSEMAMMTGNQEHVGLTEKELALKNQIRQLNEKKAEMLKAQQEEDREMWQLEKQALEARLIAAAGKAEADKEETAAELAQLRDQLSQFQTETDALQRELNKSASPRSGYTSGLDSSRVMSPELVRALEGAALQQAESEAEIERLRNQLRSRNDAHKRALDDQEQRAQELEGILQEAIAAEKAHRQNATDYNFVEMVLARQQQSEDYPSAGTTLRRHIQGGDTANMVLQETGSLLSDALPDGWQRAQDANGINYFIDHNTKTTSWNHPGYGRPTGAAFQTAVPMPSTFGSFGVAQPRPQPNHYDVDYGDSRQAQVISGLHRLRQTHAGPPPR